MTESHDLSLAVASTREGYPEADALVLGVFSGPEGPFLAENRLDADTADGLEAILEDVGVSGSLDQLYRMPGTGDGASIIALIGMGSLESEEDRVDVLRYAAGSAVRQLAGVESVVLDLPIDSAEDLAGVAEGVAYGAFTDRGQRTDPKAVKDPVAEAVIMTEIASKEAEPVLARALVLGEAVDHARRLVNEAPNSLYPDSFAGRAMERVAALDDVTTEVLDEKALEEGGFGGLIGVGKGSERGPRLVVVDYSPKRPDLHVSLVGKGITFDSGGLSLKPGNAMMTMKCDMGGAAAVLNAVAAAAELGLPLRVTGYLCLAENLPSGSATRPEDVLRMRGGKTVEVLNTDAEGRLVMADGLAYASEQKPDYLLDVATLTGAQMVALGTRYAAVMGDEQVREAIVESAGLSGEAFWPMPLPGYMSQELKSKTADLKNIGSGRMGGMLTAGLFLKEFVGEGKQGRIPWAHLDIAGPAFNEGSAYGFVPQEGTGAAVPTLVSFLEQLAEG